MNKKDRLAYQAGLRAQRAITRPTAPTPVRQGIPCPAATGRNHDFSMGRTAPRRCWFCCKTRAQVEAELAQQEGRP